MNKHFINYASNGFINSQKHAIDRAVFFGFNATAYRESDIDDDFKNKNFSVFNVKRGGGYWLWKPYIILKTLKLLQGGDYLVYMDSGAYFTKNVDNILRMINHKGVLAFSMKQKTSKWTKGDCFYHLNKNNKEDYKNNDQMQATYIFLRKCKQSVDFVQRWLSNCVSYNLITDDPNLYMDNYEDFVDHRHDQAIFSLMVYNEDIMYIPQIDQFCNEHGYADDWIMVNRHGTRS